jgi:hypothetical protein
MTALIKVVFPEPLNAAKPTIGGQEGRSTVTGGMQKVLKLTWQW